MTDLTSVMEMPAFETSRDELLTTYRTLAYHSFRVAAGFIIDAVSSDFELQYLIFVSGPVMKLLKALLEPFG